MSISTRCKEKTDCGGQTEQVGMGEEGGGTGTGQYETNASIIATLAGPQGRRSLALPPTSSFLCDRLVWPFLASTRQAMEWKWKTWRLLCCAHGSGGGTMDLEGSTGEAFRIQGRFMPSLRVSGTRGVYVNLIEDL